MLDAINGIQSTHDIVSLRAYICANDEEKIKEAEKRIIEIYKI